MTICKVLDGDDGRLHHPAHPVTAFNPDLTQVLDDLTATLQHRGGVSLSAPQIGSNLRAIVADVGDGIVELINPHIVSTEGEEFGMETCLSFPGTCLQLQRPARISVEAYDRNGNPVLIEATGALARVICHELDHLEGIVFLDRLSEEDLLSQMFSEIQSWLGEEPDGNELVMEADVNLDGIRSLDQAREAEFSQATDMLADAAWKVALAAELLRDHKDRVSSAALTELETLERRLSKWLEQVEGECSQKPD